MRLMTSLPFVPTHCSRTPVFTGAIAPLLFSHQVCRNAVHHFFSMLFAWPCISHDNLYCIIHLFKRFPVNEEPVTPLICDDFIARGIVGLGQRENPRSFEVNVG